MSNKPTIPSKTSDLTNDSDFITADDTKIPLAGSNAISGDLIPSTDGTVNLGSSNKKFASLNGISPDELGLPTSTYTDVSSHITYFDATPNVFTAPASGILQIDANGKTVVTNNILIVNAVENDGLYRSITPVAAGDAVTIYTLASSVSAIIHHLKGKI